MQQNNSHEDTELIRLERQAGAVDAELDFNEGGGEEEAQTENATPFNAELADVLDMMALAGSAILVTVPQHFNHDQNIRIADGMILLSEKYGYDLRENFLSNNSVVMLWLGLAITVGIPARACVTDWQHLREKEVKAATDEKPQATPNNNDFDLNVQTGGN